MVYFAELLPDTSSSQEPEEIQETRLHRMERLLKKSDHPYDRFVSDLFLLAPQATPLRTTRLHRKTRASRH